MQEQFNRFESVNYNPLRFYNCFVMLLNIQQDFGEVGAREYLEGFTDSEKAAIYSISVYVKKFGSKKTLDTIMRECPLEEVA